MRTALLLTGLLLTACATNTNSQIVSGDAEAAIRASNARFAEAVRAGNVAGVIRMYSDSAVIMPPNSVPVTGIDEIRRFWTGFLATGSIDATLITDDVDQSGDLAVERGRYQMTIVPVNGTAPVHDAGKYVVSWRKINGQWRATNDIFNSSSPAQ